MRPPIAASLLLFSALIGACATGRPAAAQSPLIGRPIDLEAPNLAGRPIQVADARGQVRVVDFWATWCEPCHEQLALLDRLARDAGPRGLRVYAVSVDEDRAQLEAYLAGSRYAFEVLWDRGGAQHAEPMDLQRLPATLVVDRAGSLRYVHQGFRPGDAEELTRELRLLLAEPAPPTAPP